MLGQLPQGQGNAESAAEASGSPALFSMPQDAALEVASYLTPEEAAAYGASCATLQDVVRDPVYSNQRIPPLLRAFLEAVHETVQQLRHVQSQAEDLPPVSDGGASASSAVAQRRDPPPPVAGPPNAKRQRRSDSASGSDQVQAEEAVRAHERAIQALYRAYTDAKGALHATPSMDDPDHFFKMISAVMNQPEEALRRAYKTLLSAPTGPLPSVLHWFKDADATSLLHRLKAQPPKVVVAQSLTPYESRKLAVLLDGLAAKRHRFTGVFIAEVACAEGADADVDDEWGAEAAEAVEDQGGEAPEVTLSRRRHQCAVRLAALIASGHVACLHYALPRGVCLEATEAWHQALEDAPPGALQSLGLPALPPHDASRDLVAAALASLQALVLLWGNWLKPLPLAGMPPLALFPLAVPQLALNLPPHAQTESLYADPRLGRWYLVRDALHQAGAQACVQAFSVQGLLGDPKKPRASEEEQARWSDLRVSVMTLLKALPLRFLSLFEPLIPNDLCHLLAPDHPLARSLRVLRITPPYARGRPELMPVPWGGWYAHNPGDETALPRCLNYLVAMPQLRELDLPALPASSDVYKTLFERGIMQCTRLDCSTLPPELRFFNMPPLSGIAPGVGTTSMPALVAALCAPDAKVKHLSLACVVLRSQDAVFFMRALENNRSLVSLDLSRMVVREEAALGMLSVDEMMDGGGDALLPWEALRALSDALRLGLPALRYLKLSFTGETTKDATPYHRCMQASLTQRFIRLGHETVVEDVDEGVQIRPLTTPDAVRASDWGDEVKRALLQFGAAYGRWPEAALRQEDAGSCAPGLGR